MPDSISLFDRDATRFIELIDRFQFDSYRTRYSFTSPDAYERILRDSPHKGMQIFWGEILARSHLTAVTAILRSRHWITAVTAAATSKHLLAFAAAFRGLIESAADSSSALRAIPRTLARDHARITQALSGDLGQPCFLVDQIEDELIHFSYARHLTKAELATTPQSHRARQIREYIELLESGQVTEVIACYRTLCDLTHPGASSVWMWLHPQNALEIDLAAHQDELIISNILDEYRKTFLELLMFAFNPALVTLRVLNYFPLAQFHVPEVLSLDLSQIPLWQKCQNDLKNILPRARPRRKL